MSKSRNTNSAPKLRPHNPLRVKLLALCKEGKLTRAGKIALGKLNAAVR
jgi:hypothetical protein